MKMRRQEASIRRLCDAVAYARSQWMSRGLSSKVTASPQAPCICPNLFSVLRREIVFLSFFLPSFNFANYVADSCHFSGGRPSILPRLLRDDNT